MFFAPYMVRLPHQKRFVINMQLIHCWAKALHRKKKNEKPDIYWNFLFSEKAKCVKKAWISKFGFKNAKLATLHAISDCMRLLLLGNCCVTRPGIGPPWPNDEIHTVRFVVCLQLLAYYLILLDLQLINFPWACTNSQEAPSRFPHFM